MKVIDQFIWGYQEHFRSSFQILADNVLKKIGYEGKVEALLIVLSGEISKERHSVCVEPENGKIKQELFESLPENVQLGIQKHPMQDLFYGDAQSMRDKPENIKRTVITEETRNHLERYVEYEEMQNFCSLATFYNDYYVVLVIRIEKAHLINQPTIKYDWLGSPVTTNLVYACINEILRQAEFDLARPIPEPGRNLRDKARLETSEVILRAAKRLMYAPFIADDVQNHGLFGFFEAISKQQYEGQFVRGRITIVDPQNDGVDYLFRLSSPVPLSKARWARKLLQMANDKVTLIMDYQFIYGLGSVSLNDEDFYFVDLVGYHEWDLCRRDQILLRVRNGEPMLPKDVIDKERFLDNMQRVFCNISVFSAEKAYRFAKILLELDRGSMLVFAEDAKVEADRLSRQGTKIEPIEISETFLEQATNIDGSILASPEGICYAIGVILDGNISDDCKAGRGGRFNSAVRYINSSADKPRLALIYSDDGSLDVYPLLRPQIDLEELEKNIANLEVSSKDDYHEFRNYLDDHRFYLTEEQCKKVNAALDRIKNEPREVGEILLNVNVFVPDPKMNSSYYKS